MTTITVPKAELDRLNTILRRGHRLPNYRDDETIASFTADAGGGREVEVKVVNGDPPYVDAVLFRGHTEIAVCEPGEQLDGEYLFDVDDGEMTVTVVVERE
jgi:hypothetical protein